jgi:hypothetical protein
MTSNKARVIPEFKTEEHNVTYLNTGHQLDVETDTQEQTEQQIKDPPSWRWLGPVVALVLIVLSAFLGRVTVGDDGVALAESEAAATEATSRYQQAETELLAAQAEEIRLSNQLQQVQAELAEAIDPEVVALLETSEAALQEEVAAAGVQIELQSERLAELQQELETAARVNEQLQLDVETANAQVDAQAMRITDLGAALETSEQLVPSRAQAAFELLAGMSFSTKMFDIGEVRYDIVRPGLWDDETQYFFGSGEVGYTNDLTNSRFVLADDSTIQAVIPLPRVQEVGAVQLHGQTDTEREQFARIGGRWGDQTEMFVLDEARAVAHQMACQDANALRQEMSELSQLANQLARGYKLEIHWQDTSGILRTSVTDAQLLANAC